jgi:hypothetical protein
MQVGLVDVVVFRTNVELVSLFLGKFHGVHTCVLLVIVTELLIKQEEADFRIAQFTKVP